MRGINAVVDLLVGKNSEKIVKTFADSSTDPDFPHGLNGTESGYPDEGLGIASSEMEPFYIPADTRIRGIPVGEMRRHIENISLLDFIYRFTKSIGSGAVQAVYQKRLVKIAGFQNMLIRIEMAAAHHPYPHLPFQR